MRNKHDMGDANYNLKKKLRAVILLESSKPYKEMDSDLVAECVDFLMELKGRKKLTKEEIEERIEKIPFDGSAIEAALAYQRKIRLRTLAIIAAVLIMLFGIFVVSVADTGLPYDRWLRSVGNDGYRAFLEKGHTEFEGIDYYSADEHVYSSVYELVENEGYPMLYPEWIPEGDKITKICYQLSLECEVYMLNFTDVEHGVSMYIGQKLPEEAKTAHESKEIGGFTVYYFVRGNKAQANFEYNNCLVYVVTDTEENLFKIIENLKEIK